MKQKDASGHRLIKKFKWTTPGDLARILRVTIQESSKSSEVKTVAILANRMLHCDSYERIFRLRNYLKTRYIFVRDPQGVEYVQSPTYLCDKLLNGETIAGDCDDITCLVLSICKAMGYEGFMVFVSPKGFKMPYTHVLPTILTPEPFQEVIPIELTTEIENMTKLKPIAVMRV